MSGMQNRYPGIRPFTTEEKDRFFGREEDVDRFIRLVNLEQVVILYGKSGYGKSSMLRAGVYPKLEEQNRYQRWELRFGPFESYKPSLADMTCDALSKHADPAHPLREILGDETTIWTSLKTQQTHNNKRFLLFFDQFEELFTYPAEQILQFKQQLAEALYNAVPEEFATELEADPGALNFEQEVLFYTPFELKVVFAIRSDRMSQLNTLKDYLPNLLQHAYELRALNQTQATEAIVRPAALAQEEEFNSPPFQYAPATISTILAALDDDDGFIETSNLQIVCRHVEENIIKPALIAGALPDELHITPETLGDVKRIFQDFYENTLHTLSAGEQAVTRHITEDVLVSPDGIRLPFAEQALLAEPGVTQLLLDRLVSASLLRIERDEQGRMIYEISHDTLVAPILEAAKLRRESEQMERLRREAEEARLREAEARRRQRRARIFAAGAIALALFAMGAFFWALRQTQVARAQRQIAQEQTTLANENADLAHKKTNEAEANAERARLALIEVQHQKDATEEQRQLAETNYHDAQRALEAVRKANVLVVDVLLNKAREEIYHLNYDNALGILEKGLGLGVRQTELAHSLLELGYFFGETGAYTRAKNVLLRCDQLLTNQSVDHLLNQIVPQKGEQNRQFIRNAVQKLDPGLFASYEQRYYPELLPVPGGSFLMGCDTMLEPDFRDYSNRSVLEDELPRFRVDLQDFHLGRTEMTFWQYFIYATSQGIDIINKKRAAFPWGLDGDNPAVNVSWFDAAHYANWLSKRMDKDTVYLFSNYRKEVWQGGDVEYDMWDVSIRYEANGFRLPTEAEFEYAAKGGAKPDGTLYSGGNEIDSLGWYFQNSNDRSHPVARKTPSKLGLYDLSGNVWEWCNDWIGPYPAEDRQNYAGLESGVKKAQRGGSFDDENFNCNVNARYAMRPWGFYYWSGFRLARRP